MVKSQMVATGAPSRRGGPPGAVLCTIDGSNPEQVNSSHRRRRGRFCAAAWSDQHDAGRFAEPVAEADAVASAATIRGHRHHHADGLGDGAEAIVPSPRWEQVMKKRWSPRW